MRVTRRGKFRVSTETGPGASPTETFTCSYEAGYKSVVGTSSCCSVPSCPIGCAIGKVVSTLAACKAQCAAASDCSYSVPGTSLTLQLCSDCVSGCPGVNDCEAGCALSFTDYTPQAWKALLPPQSAGGDYVLTATCSNCITSAIPMRSLSHVTFGTVFVCSGQSNMVRSCPCSMMSSVGRCLCMHHF